MITDEPALHRTAYEEPRDVILTGDRSGRSIKPVTQWSPLTYRPRPHRVLRGGKSGADIAGRASDTAARWTNSPAFGVHVAHTERAGTLRAHRPVGTWPHKTGHKCGYAMDLAALRRPPSSWRTLRLDAGHGSPDPAAAAAYFTEVGLHGSLWGLPDRDPRPA